MNRTARKRFQLTEYGDPRDLVDEISQHARETGSAADPASILGSLQAASLRVSTALGHTISEEVSPGASSRLRPELEFIGVGHKTRVRARNFAGIFNISHACDIEVIPKFLADNATGWREDFFYLATLSRHGRLLQSDDLRAAPGSKGDLISLVARSFVRMYERNRPRPIRTYFPREVIDFYLDGEVDAAEIALPDEDGFHQVVLTYGGENVFNDAISAAALWLASRVGEPALRDRLARIVDDLPRPPGRVPTRPRRLPGRVAAWQPVYDLAIDVLNGLGGSFNEGDAIAPGFVAETWRLWEDLLTAVSRMAFGSSQVSVQKRIPLGIRQRPGGGAAGIHVKPDIVIQSLSDGSRVAVDAKYKSPRNPRLPFVSTADVYEALAFARATKIARIVLAYPGFEESLSGEPGAAQVKEVIEIDDVSLIALEFQIAGISRAGGLQQFRANFADAVVRSQNVCRQVDCK